jgi:hypothetical protein
VLRGAGGRGTPCWQPERPARHHLEDIPTPQLMTCGGPRGHRRKMCDCRVAHPRTCSGLNRKCRADFERSAVRRMARMHTEALEWRIAPKFSHIFNGPTTPTYTNGWHLRHQHRGWRCLIGGVPAIHKCSLYDTLAISPAFADPQQCHERSSFNRHSTLSTGFRYDERSISQDRPQIGIEYRGWCFKLVKGKLFRLPRSHAAETAPRHMRKTPATARE